MAESRPTTNQVLDGLREVVSRIEAQESCGTCEFGHDGCFVSTSLAIAKEVLARFEPKVCGKRYLVETLADIEQDARMVCSLYDGHLGRHRNASGDLAWAQGFEVSVAAALDSPEPEVPEDCETCERHDAARRRCLALGCNQRQDDRHDRWWCDYGCCSRDHVVAYYGEEGLDV